jgi:hypothetical protein
MTARNFALLAATIFAIMAVLQLMRAILGWPVTVDMGWGNFRMPVWPNWVAALGFGILAWLGFAVARSGVTRSD